MQFNTPKINNDSDENDNQSDMRPSQFLPPKPKKKKFAEESGIRSIKGLFAQLKDDEDQREEML